MHHLASTLYHIGLVLLAGQHPAAPQSAATPARPNILVLISDDQSWLHTGVASKTVKTPHFDRVAAEGVLFRHAFCSSPGCAPSRASMLSGQPFWRLGEGSVQRAGLPADIPVYPEILAQAGYHVGSQGKGWAPGTVRRRPFNPAGKAYRNFAEFLAAAPPNAPFCFWFGSTAPHRPYVAGSGRSAGKRLEDAVVPSFLPDSPEVRSDLLDYYAEIERFDRDIGEVLDTLDRSGKAADTLVVVTSDNGMPFPRAKTNLYDYGVRMPLAVRWPARIHGRRVVDDFVNLADCAPTFLEVAGLPIPPAMVSRSFLNVLLSDKDGRVDPTRDHAVFGREFHGRSWPCRALRNEHWLYIRNFAPERIDGLICDNSPTQQFLIEHARDPRYEPQFQLAFGPRPAEELYDVQSDPEQVVNVAQRPEHAAVLRQLREALEAELKRTADPRILGRGAEFDGYAQAATNGKKPPASAPQPKEDSAPRVTPHQAVAPSADEPRSSAASSRQLRCELAVIGGGSGGFAAALAAARFGVDVILVEKGDCLGGTSVRSGVNCWEMGAGGTGIPFDVYRRLKKIPNAVGFYSFGRHGSWYNPNRDPFRYPGGETVIDTSLRYLDTLQRHVPPGFSRTETFSRRVWHGVPFEPDAMAQTMLAMLRETGRCRVLLDTAFVKADTASGRLQAVTLSSGVTIAADYFVDATGDGLVCLSAGCQAMIGQESRDTFGEPSAPDKASDKTNGVTLIYRATPVHTAAIEPLPDGIPEACWWRKAYPSAHINHYPNGDLNINILPTMDGNEFQRLGYDATMTECQRRVRAHWRHLQTHYEEFRHFRLSWIAPALGIRESRRIVGEYVLTQLDLSAGISGQKHPDIIALADHSMDTHGDHAKGGEMREPYGIPYRCLIPKGQKNLLVACRAASFSSLAASSCRLSRTMMQLGQAAGTAVALAKPRKADLPDVPADAIRKALREQHVQLEHPLSNELRAYLADE